MSTLRSGSTGTPHWPGRLALALLLAVSLLPAFASAAHRGLHAQIVGGQPVSQGTYPFLAHLEIDLGAFVVLCGGSLIAPHFVVTAAHCVEDSDTGALFRPSQFSVVVGQANLGLASAANTFGVTAVHQDPAWIRATNQNDAAVLTLDRDVPATIAQPVSFVAAGDQQYDSAGQAAIVAGWGTTREGSQTTPDQLLAAPLTVVGAADCQRAYDDLNPAVELCAAAPGRDSCQGDSGGPLLAPQGVAAATTRVRAHGGRHGSRVAPQRHHHYSPLPPPPPPVQLPTQVTQIGITSFGIGCARPGIPGVYTRLSNAGVNAFVAGVLAGG